MISSRTGIGSRQTGHGTSMFGSFPFCENPVTYALMQDSQKIWEHGKVLGVLSPSSHSGHTNNKSLPGSLNREEDISTRGVPEGRTCEETGNNSY